MFQNFICKLITWNLESISPNTEFAKLVHNHLCNSRCSWNTTSFLFTESSREQCHGNSHRHTTAVKAQTTFDPGFWCLGVRLLTLLWQGLPHPNFSSPFPKGSFFFFLLESLRDWLLCGTVALASWQRWDRGRENTVAPDLHQQGQPASSRIFCRTSHKVAGLGQPPSSCSLYPLGNDCFRFSCFVLDD